MNRLEASRELFAMYEQTDNDGRWFILRRLMARVNDADLIAMVLALQEGGI